MTRVVGTGASRGGPYHGQQGQRRQAPGRLGAGHGLPPVPLDGLIGDADEVGRPRRCKWGKTKDPCGERAGRFAWPSYCDRRESASDDTIRA